MLSVTNVALEKFDNTHDFERMCSDILNKLGNTHVTPIAPKGGKDGGKDITYTNPSGEKSLAFVSLEKQAITKFKKDARKRKKGEFTEYTFFTNQYISASQKLDLSNYCSAELEATLIIRDIESLRSHLDTVLQDVKEQYLQIKQDSSPGYKIRVKNLLNYSAIILERNAHQILVDKKAEFQSESMVANSLPAVLRSIGYRSPAGVLEELEEYKVEVSNYHRNISKIYAFNLEIVSDKYDENIQVQVTTEEGRVFEFRPESLEKPSKPNLEMQTSIYSGMRVGYLGNLNPGNVSPRDKDEFYATLTNKNTVVKSNISALNPNQPKDTFDELVYLEGIPNPIEITLLVTIYSKYISDPPVLKVVLNLNDAEIREIQ